MPGDIVFLEASDRDVPEMEACRVRGGAGAADQRMAAYFRGEHHPQRALAPRTGYIAVAEAVVVGYIAGHLSTRHGCDAEVQYLFVASDWRRRGVATGLLGKLAVWFKEHGAARVCVNVDLESPEAEPFYRAMGAHPLSEEKRFWYLWEDVGALGLL